MRRALLTGLLLPWLVVSAGGWSGQSLDDYIQRPGFAWRMAGVSNITIYYEPDTRAEREIERLQTNFVNNVVTVSQLLGTPPYSKRIHVFVLESGERKKVLMGDPGWGSAIPKRNVVFGVFNERGDGCSTHEFCHVIAGNLWGIPERWMDEGLATYSDERWRERLHREAAALAARNKLLPLATLFRDFLNHPESVAYVEAGSFVRFLHERFGIETVKKIWQSGHAKLPKVTGSSPENLEREWRSAIDAAADRSAPRKDSVASPTQAR